MYLNQRQHDKLKRKYAIEKLKELISLKISISDVREENTWIKNK